MSAEMKRPWGWYMVTTSLIWLTPCFLLFVRTHSFVLLPHIRFGLESRTLAIRSLFLVRLYRTSIPLSGFFISSSLDPAG